MKNIISLLVFLLVPIISIAQPYGYTPRTGSGSSTFTGGTVTSTIVSTDDFIGYAITGVNGNSGGPTSGPRGNVVDSSVPVNRLVHFKLSVPQ